MAPGHGGEHGGKLAQPDQVALPALVGVQGNLGQRRQHGADRRGERVADGELDQGHRRGVRQAPRHAAHEVECLQLGLGQAVVGRSLGAFGEGRQEPRVRGLRGLTEVREEGVVAGKPVERTAQGVGVEDRSEQLGREIVSGHRGRLPRTTRRHSRDQGGNDLRARPHARFVPEAHLIAPCVHATLK